MNILDVFNQDVFQVVSLTTAINTLPHKPSFLESVLQFDDNPINTAVAVLEYEHGRLQLLSTSARGSQQDTEHSDERQVKHLKVPHVPQHSVLLADDVNGIRKFGGGAADVEDFSAAVAKRLKKHRDNHDVTLEYHRAGCLSGIVRDKDGSSLLNMFTEFGVTEQGFTFDLRSSATVGDLQGKCREVTNYMEDKLGGQSNTGVRAACDDAFFEALIKLPEVRESYDRWNNGQRHRDPLTGRDKMWEWGGIEWFNYRGKIGTRNFLDGGATPSGFCRFWPTGVPELFTRTIAPADYIEAVGTMGKPYYAKQHRMKMDKGIEFETQTNQLFACTRPSTLAKGVATLS